MQSSAIPLHSTPVFQPKLTNFPPKNNYQFLFRTNFFTPRMASASSLSRYYPIRSLKVDSSSIVTDDDANGFSTLMEYVGKGGLNVGDDLAILLHHIQYACKRIAALVASPFNSSLARHIGRSAAAGTDVSGRDAPKPLDIVSVSLLSSL